MDLRTFGTERQGLARGIKRLRSGQDHRLCWILVGLAACSTTPEKPPAAESDTATSCTCDVDEDVAELREQLAELQTEQARQAEGLAECFNMAEDAAANAAAAQERSSALETSVVELEEQVNALWSLVVALYRSE